MVGPGRGSGAGSIVAYSLGITAIDPLKYNLLFERFLNPERVSMPDLDIDFCYERRQEVIDYVARRYGEDHVAQIITFGTMAAKAVVRDVGRVLGYPYAEGGHHREDDPVRAGYDAGPRRSISTPSCKARYEDGRARRSGSSIWRCSWRACRATRVHPRGGRAHHAEPRDRLRARCRKTTTWSPPSSPRIRSNTSGLLKMDFLGLRTLTVIRDTLDMMREAGVDDHARGNSDGRSRRVRDDRLRRYGRRVPAGKRRHAHVPFQHEAELLRGYHRRHFALPSRSDGEHPALYRGQERPLHRAATRTNACAPFST